MDWLSFCEAKVACDKEQVRLRAPDGTKLVVQGEKASSDVRVISMLKARKFIRRGYETFLAYLIDTKKETENIQNVPVVREFQDVFPEELPGLPPAREIEFKIDLVPGARPVAKTPYRFAPSEMKELSAQLQELLDK